MQTHSFIGGQVLEITLELILDALANADAIETASFCREEIVKGFNLALEGSGMPAAQVEKLKLK